MFDLIEVILPTFSLRTHDVEYVALAVMVFFVWQNLKLSKRVKQLEEPTPLMEKKPSDYVLVRKGMYELPIPVGSEFVVPTEFPLELTPYVKRATLGEISKWLLAVNDMTDLDQRHDVQRAITMGAMINRNYIPTQLFRTDDRARVLWQRWKMDMTPTDPVVILQKLASADFAITEWDKQQIAYFVAALHVAGVLIAKYSVHWDFVAYKEFAKLFRVQLKAPEHFLSDEAIKSIVTVYAVRAVVKIPASYVSYDYLTVLIMRADDKKEKPVLKLVVKEQFEDVRE